MSSHASSERSILVIDGDPLRSQAIGRILSAVAKEVGVCNHILEADVAREWDFLVVHIDTLSEEDREQFLGMLSPSIVRERLLLLTSRAGKEGLFQLIGQIGVSNLLACTSEIDERALLATTRMMFGAKDLHFGVEQYLGPEFTHLDFPVKHSDDRYAVIDAIADFARSLSLDNRRVQQIETLADEFMTNALWNAPVDAEGRPLYAHLPRTTKVELPGSAVIQVRAAADERSFGLAVADPFGSLSETRIVESLRRCMGEDGTKPREGAGGAGLGLLFALQLVSNYVLHIEPGVRTVAIGLFDRRMKMRDFAKQPKSFNVFVARSAEQ